MNARTFFDSRACPGCGPENCHWCASCVAETQKCEHDAVDVSKIIEERDTLARWKSTNAPRIHALEGLLEHARKEAANGKEAIASLASEREANAILTSENERLKAENLGLLKSLVDVRAEIERLTKDRDVLLDALKNLCADELLTQDKWDNARASIAKITGSAS